MDGTFNRDDHKQLAWKRVREETPYLLIGFPPCTYFSILQELNKSVHGSKPGWLEKFDKETEKAINHVDFCSALYKIGAFYMSIHGRPGPGS